MPTVAKFCTQYLAYSQTFVHEEVRQHTRYRAEVFCRRRINVGQFPHEPVHTGGPVYPYTRWSARFVRLFSEHRYDVIHAHFGTSGINAMYYAKRFNLPLLVTFHGWEVPLLESQKRFLPKHWGYALLGPKLLTSMSGGLCASRELLEMLVDLGAPRERLTVHYMGIDIDRFAPKARDPNAVQVIMVGRFVEKKGFEYGIRAFAAAARGSTAHLTLVGDGVLARQLRRLITTLNLEPQVTFAGVLSQQALADRLGRSDILLAPSVVARDGNRDSGLIVAKEASAAHVVPIGTHHGGIPDIIEDGHTGFLVPERDVDLMAARLKTLLLDADLRRRLGRAAREKMEREYDNRLRVAALEDAFDQTRAMHTKS